MAAANAGRPFGARALTGPRCASLGTRPGREKTGKERARAWHEDCEKPIRMRHAPLFALLAVALLGCGGRSQQVCASEKHRANPDGRGDRCIDDRSTCDTPTDCASANPCCTATCEDQSGSGLYACVDSCPDLGCMEVACGNGWRCEAPDECRGWCVPQEVTCPEGQIAAEPAGNGEFVCIDAASTCVHPDDCPASADGCCMGVCWDQGGGVFGCDVMCEDAEAPPPGDGGADADADADQEWVCTVDADCEAMYGAGWTCSTSRCSGNTCEPPAPECTGDEDCVLAVNLAECCTSCPLAYSWEELWADPCLSQTGGGAGEAPPDDGDPGAPLECEMCLADMICPEVLCAEATVACLGGQCVAESQ